MFSRTCEYAIKIMIYIATTNDGRVGLDEISTAIASPKAFTAKILQQLSRAKLLDSIRGKSGGFLLPEDRNIILADIVIAIDGDKILKGCVLGFKDCSEQHPCPVHHQYKNVRNYISETLLSKSMSELSMSVFEKESYLMCK